MSVETKPVYSQGKLDPIHPTLTQSWLNTMEACPFAANERYNKGIISPPSGSILRGKSADAAVTFGANRVIESGQDASLKDKRDVAMATFEKEKPGTDFQGEDPDALEKRTLALVDLHHNQVAPTLNPLKTQEAIKVEGLDFDLAGTIDLVEAASGGVILSDLKTANTSNKHKVEGAAQPALYTHLYEKKFGHRPLGFRFDVLVDLKTPKVERVDGVVTNHDDGLLAYRFHVAFAEWKRGLETGEWRLAEQGHWRCEKTGKWCAYLHNGCPKGRKL